MNPQRSLRKVQLSAAFCVLAFLIAGPSGANTVTTELDPALSTTDQALYEAIETPPLLESKDQFTSFYVKSIGNLACTRLAVPRAGAQDIFHCEMNAQAPARHDLLYSVLATPEIPIHSNEDARTLNEANIKSFKKAVNRLTCYKHLVDNRFHYQCQLQKRGQDLIVNPVWR